MSTTDATAAPGAVLYDARGYRRSKATLPGHNAGLPPKNKGRTYPPSPPNATEVAKLLAACPDSLCGARHRALIALMWRTGLRISEALALDENDLDRSQGTVLVRCGKNGKRRITGMDEWGWVELERWMTRRRDLPPGAVFCVAHGPTAGRALNPTAARKAMRALCITAGVRKRVSPHQMRHAHAVDLHQHGFADHDLMRQLGHSNLVVTNVYLRSISDEHVAAKIAKRPAPVIPIAH